MLSCEYVKKFLLELESQLKYIKKIALGLEKLAVVQEQYFVIRSFLLYLLKTQLMSSLIVWLLF
jgi:hypothetical protein